MEITLFEWLGEIPTAIANFSNWLTEPINATYINISPLGLLGAGGFTILLAILLVHIVRLFI